MWGDITSLKEIRCALRSSRILKTKGFIIPSVPHWLQGQVCLKHCIKVWAPQKACNFTVWMYSVSQGPLHSAQPAHGQENCVNAEWDFCTTLWIRNYLFRIRLGCASDFGKFRIRFQTIFTSWCTKSCLFNVWSSTIVAQKVFISWFFSGFLPGNLRIRNAF